MPPKSAARAADKPAKKTKSTGGGGKKKLSVYNQYMKSEMARLKETEPDLLHKDRFSLATANWKTAKENPKVSA